MPRFGLAAAAVVIATTVAVIVRTAAQAVVATAAEQDQQDDDPAHVATTEAVVIHKNTSIGKFQRHQPLIPCYSAAAKVCGRISFDRAEKVSYNIPTNLLQG